MHQAVRRAISAYLKEGHFPTLEETGLAGSEASRTKDPLFVTLYRDGKVVASSGRIHLKAESTAKELIEHSILCLKDPRFPASVKSPEDLADVRMRVDVIKTSGRRVLASIGALDMRKEGVIFLAQGRNALSVVLPGTYNLAETPEQVLDIAMKKAGVDPASVKEEEYVVYGIETVVSSDF